MRLYPRPQQDLCLLAIRQLGAGLCLFVASSLFAGIAGAAELVVVAGAPLPKSADTRLPAWLAAHQGRPVLINFWATWCEPCREEMPALQRLAGRWQARGLVVITVAVADNARRVEQFLADNAALLPVIDDREQVISRAWRAWSLPTTVLLDRHHRVRLRGLGPIDWDSATIDNRMEILFN